MSASDSCAKPEPARVGDVLTDARAYLAGAAKSPDLIYRLVAEVERLRSARRDEGRYLVETHNDRADLLRAVARVEQVCGRPFDTLEVEYGDGRDSVQATPVVRVVDVLEALGERAAR